MGLAPGKVSAVLSQGILKGEVSLYGRPPVCSRGDGDIPIADLESTEKLHTWAVLQVIKELMLEMTPQWEFGAAVN